MALMVHESPKGDENHIHELYHSDGLRWQGSRKKDGKVSSKFSAGMGLARPNSVKPVQQSLGIVRKVPLESLISSKDGLEHLQQVAKSSMN